MRPRPEARLLVLVARARSVRRPFPPGRRERVPCRPASWRRGSGRRASWRGRSGNDRGQSTPLGAAMLALALLVAAAIGPMGRALGARAQARTAADAAALAGAADGEEAAGEMADANGARLARFTRDGDEVVVEVRVGDVSAWASARGARLPPAPAGPWPPPGSGPGAGGPATGGSAARGPGSDRAGLAPAMAAALGRVDDLLGRTVPVASGLRTRAEQQALWDRRHVNPYPVARPGTSDHETGLAVDIPRAHVPDVLAVAALAGLCQPLPESDPVHFVVCGT